MASKYFPVEGEQQGGTKGMGVRGREVVVLAYW